MAVHTTLTWDSFPQSCDRCGTTFVAILGTSTPGRGPRVAAAGTEKLVEKAVANNTIACPKCGMLPAAAERKETVGSRARWILGIVAIWLFFMQSNVGDVFDSANIGYLTWGIVALGAVALTNFWGITYNSPGLARRRIVRNWTADKTVQSRGNPAYSGLKMIALLGFLVATSAPSWREPTDVAIWTGRAVFFGALVAMRWMATRRFKGVES